jgi:hypothetical protein
LLLIFLFAAAVAIVDISILVQENIRPNCSQEEFSVGFYVLSEANSIIFLILVHNI